MNTILAGHFDFILLCYALALAFLGAISIFIRRERAGTLPWVWLAVYAFGHATVELLRLAEEGLGLPESLTTTRLWGAALSYVLLAEFGRRALARTLPSRIPGPWIHLALIVAAVGMGGGDLSVSGVSVRYLFGTGGGLAAALALFRARGLRGQPSRPLGLAALLLAAHALLAGLSVPPAPVFPASVLNNVAFFAAVGVPIELVRAVILGVLALVLFGYHFGSRRAEHPGLPGDTIPQIAVLVVLANVLAGGWFASDALGRLEERDFRADLMAQAATTAAAFSAANPARAGADTAPSAAGRDHLRDRLSAIRAESPYLRRLYLLERRGRLVLTVADSALADSPRALAPVPRFFLPPGALDAAFDNGTPSMTGPLFDRLTALVAVRSPEDGQVVSVLGFEVDAARLGRVISRGRLTGIVVTLGLVHLLMAFAYFRQRSWEADRIMELSNRRLRDAQSVAHVGSWSLDYATGRMTWSQEMFTVVGRDPSLGPPSAEEFEGYFLPEDAERRRDALARARVDGKNYEVALRLRRTDGEIRSLVSLVWPERDDTGAVVRAMGTTTDVTEKIRAEEATRAEKDRVQQYLDVAGIMMVVIGADEKVELVNRKACEVLGFASDELVGQNWFDAVVQDRERPRTRVAFGAVMEGRLDLAGTFENLIVTRGGEELLISWNNSLIRDASGKAVATLSSGEDVTERRRAEDSVMELNATLELRVMERTAEIEHALSQLRVESAERTRAEESLRQAQQVRLSAAEALNSVSKVLTDVTLDYEAALDALAHHLSAMEGDACLVSLVSDDGKWLYPVAFHHVNPPKAKSARTLFATRPYRLGQGLATRALVEDGQARVVSSLSRDELGVLVRHEDAPLLVTYEPTSFAAAPMRAHGRVLGTIALLRDDASSPLIEDHKALLQATADRAALTLTTSRLYAKNLAQAETLRQTNLQLEEKIADRTDALEQANAKLELLATHDGLTDLLNRRHLDEVLIQECRRSQRRGETLAVIMCDIDYFKRYNDRYGHGAGDDALKQVAACIRSVFRRASDFTARYGGEEFVVVAAETAPEHVPTMADRLREAVAALGVPHESSDVAPVVTVSVGAISAVSGGDRNPAWFLAQADAALYRAKSAGRNRAETVVLEGTPSPVRT